MAITEIITPFLKQDAATKTAFNSIIKPLLSSIVKVAPGAKMQVVGRMISENNINVEEDFRPMMGIGKIKVWMTVPSLTSAEWQSESNFLDFVKSKEFGSFAASVKPYATVPAQLQVFETDQGPNAVLSSRLMEVFRVSINDSERASQAQHVWKFFTGALESKVHGIESISGTSLNLEDKLLVGIIGWKGSEVCALRTESMDVDGTAANSKRSVMRL